MLLLGTKRTDLWQPSRGVLMNRDSPQAVGLEYWWPLRGAGDYRDMIRGEVLTPVGGAQSTTVTEYGQAVRIASSCLLRAAATTPRVAAAPLTICGWVRPESGTDGSLATIANGASGNDYFQVWFNTGTLNAESRDSGGAQRATISGVVTGRWQFMGMTSAATNQRVAWLNGARGATNTGTAAPSGPTRVSIGALDRSSPADYLVGAVADVRVYSRALSDAEMFALYDPQTRWDLYWVPSTKVHVFLGASGATVVGASRASALALYQGHAKPAVSGATRASARNLYAGAAQYAVVGAHRAQALQLYAGTTQQGVAGAHRASARVLNAGTVGLTTLGAHRATTLQFFGGRVATVDYVTGVHRASSLVLTAGHAKPVVSGVHLASALELYPGVTNGLLGARRGSELQFFAGAVRLNLTGTLRASTLTFGPGAVAATVIGAHRASTTQVFTGTARSVVTGAHRASSLSLTAGAVALRVTGASRGATTQVFAGTASGTLDVSGATRATTLQLFAGAAIRTDVAGAFRASALSFTAGAAALRVVGAHRPTGLVFRPGFIGDYEERMMGDDFIPIGGR